MEVFIIVGIILCIAFISWLVDICGKARKYDNLKPKLDNLDTYKNELVIMRDEFEDDKIRWQFKCERREKEWEEKVRYDLKAIKILAKEKSQGFPWLACAYAVYFNLEDLETSRYLKQKKHPAKKAAEEVKKIASKRRKAEKLYRILKYQLEYYEKLFPWLVDFKSEDIDDLITQMLSSEDQK